MTPAIGDQFPRPRRTSRRTVLLTLAGAAIGLAVATSAYQTARGAQSPPSASPGAAGSQEDVSLQIVAAANAFLGTLSESERAMGLFEWSDTAQKQRWSNLPEGGFERAGLMWGDLGEAPREAWLRLMQVTLSPDGYNQVIAEWLADDVLATEDDGGGGGGLLFGTQYYWVAIIGEPSESDPWQWQWGGHHVTINATLVGPNLSLTPSFIGVQPATYTDADGQTVRPLGAIEDDAFTLIGLLDDTQRQAAILGDTSIDLVLGPGQDGRILQPEGLPAAQMTAEQRDAFLRLIGHYGGLANAEHAASRMAEIEQGLDDTYLAWYGPTEPGSAAYFRVTGPTVVIEYSPQQMGGDAANHIHGIYRDPTDDYGARDTGITIAS